MRGKTLLWIVCLLILPLAFADTDHGGADWNITTSTNASGYHYNIRSFYLQPGVTLNITPYNTTLNATTGFLKINATNIYLWGNLSGDGAGHGGGSGGGGGSGAEAVDGSSASTGGTGTDQNGTNGLNGDAGTTSRGGDGASGGAGSPGTNPGLGGAGSQSNENPGIGNPGTAAPTNNDTSIAINASMGHGGGAGGGGGGGDRQSGNPGGGGGGGGIGGDGGAALILIARNQLVANGTIFLRSGQEECGLPLDGTDGTASGNPIGGTGGRNNRSNCIHTVGGDGGASLAAGGVGGTGGTGGAGAGGMIVLAAYSMNLTGALLDVSGGNVATNGTIKILARGGVANGTYTGYSSFVFSNYSDPWFANNAISWLQNISSITAPWNTTFFLDLNATNSSACNVSEYTSNDSLYAINSTTGVVTWPANFSRIGNRTVLFQANDTCSNTIDHVIPISITYTTPNLTAVMISPSPTGTSQPLICTATLVNPDGSTFQNTTKWYRNGTLQASLTDVANVSTGNLSLGDQWICQYNGTDTRTTLGPQNSTTLTLGDSSTPSINSFTASDTTATTQTGTITYSVNCTDNETIGSVKIEITEPSTAKTNFTATLNAGLYTYTYPVPGTAGTYNARTYCTDGSQNTATQGTLNFTAVPASSGGGGGAGGGGGGGTTTVIQGDQCEFSIVRPTNGFVNTLCRTGQRSNTFEFVLQNEETTTKTYTTRFKGVNCTIDQATFSVNGKAQHSSFISACVCPTDVSLEGSIEITTETCTGELPIKLYNGVFSRIVFDQDFLLKFMIGFFLVAIIATAIVLATGS